MKRERSFEAGNCYDHFCQNNFIPLHSFMLDLKYLDVKNLKYFEDQCFMEDYFLILQLFTRENVDWSGLRENEYIGDYIYRIDNSNSLAVLNEDQRKDILSSEEYKLCDQRIQKLRKSICR